MKRHTNQIYEAILKYDWCHLCGYRNEMFFVTTYIPENAEHSTKGGRFLRICSNCIEDMKNEIQNEIMMKIEDIYQVRRND